MHERSKSNSDHLHEHNRYSTSQQWINAWFSFSFHFLSALAAVFVDFHSLWPIIHSIAFWKTEQNSIRKQNSTMGKSCSIQLLVERLTWLIVWQIICLISSVLCAHAECLFDLVWPKDDGSPSETLNFKYKPLIYIEHGAIFAPFFFLFAWWRETLHNLQCKFYSTPFSFLAPKFRFRINLPNNAFKFTCVTQVWVAYVTPTRLSRAALSITKMTLPVMLRLIAFKLCSRTNDMAIFHWPLQIFTVSLNFVVACG